MGFTDDQQTVLIEAYGHFGTTLPERDLKTLFACLVRVIVEGLGDEEPVKALKVLTAGVLLSQDAGIHIPFDPYNWASMVEYLNSPESH